MKFKRQSIKDKWTLSTNLCTDGPQWLPRTMKFLFGYHEVCTIYLMISFHKIVIWIQIWFLIVPSVIFESVVTGLVKIASGATILPRQSLVILVFYIKCVASVQQNYSNVQLI